MAGPKDTRARGVRNTRGKIEPHQRAQLQATTRLSVDVTNAGRKPNAPVPNDLETMRRRLHSEILRWQHFAFEVSEPRARAVARVLEALAFGLGPDGAGAAVIGELDERAKHFLRGLDAGSLPDGFPVSTIELRQHELLDRLREMFVSWEVPRTALDAWEQWLAYGAVIVGQAFAALDSPFRLEVLTRPSRIVSDAWSTDFQTAIASSAEAMQTRSAMGLKSDEPQVLPGSNASVSRAVPHGTQARYLRGCRCALCTNAMEHDRATDVGLAAEQLISAALQARWPSIPDMKIWEYRRARERVEKRHGKRPTTFSKIESHRCNPSLLASEPRSSDPPSPHARPQVRASRR